MDMAPDWYRDAWKNSEYCRLMVQSALLYSAFISGSFGQEGMDYKDWLNCTVKHPLALN